MPSDFCGFLGPPCHFDTPGTWCLSSSLNQIRAQNPTVLLMPVYICKVKNYWPYLHVKTFYGLFATHFLTYSNNDVILAGSKSCM